MSRDVADLREEIAGLDRAILELLERRFKLGAEVGLRKAEAGQPIKVRDVEQRVLKRAREAAETCCVSAGVMESIFAAIIRGSVERQHRVGVERGARGGRSVLVLGAAGAMGGWLRRFLESIGHRPAGVDLAWAGLPPQEGRYATLEDVFDLDRFDALFVAVPLDRTAKVLFGLAGRGLAMPVIEIASIKSPLSGALAALRSKGTPAISLHPMFRTPDTPF